MKQRLKINGKEIIDLLIEFSYLAVIFTVPIYFAVAFPTYNIFELNKLFFFKIFTWLLFFLTAIKLVFYRIEFPFKKYFLFPAIFIAGLGITLFFSINPQQSFFGSYDWQEGYLSYLFYFVWFVLVLFNLRTINNNCSKDDCADSWQKRINRIIITISISSFVVSIYGILQIMGIDFLSWPEDPLITKRTISTFGQPNFLASWLLLVIPLGIYSIYKSKKFLFRFFYLLILTAELFCLFFTSSRGGLVAFGFVCLLFIVYLIFFTNLKKIHKIFICSGLAIILVSGFVGLNIFSPGRISGLLDFKSGSLAARINFFSAAADAITKKPIFGYGLENSGEVFISYYQPDWGIYGNVSASTDRAHNLILDIVLFTGFLGLILFIILYYCFFRLATDNINQGKMKELSLALLLGASAYLLSLMFSFTIVSGEVYFWFYLAILAVINIDQNVSGKIELRNFKKCFLPIKVSLVLIIFLVSGWGVYYEFRVLAADHYFNKLFYTLTEKQYFAALLLDDYIDEAALNPVNQDNYNRFLGDKLSDFYPQINELAPKKVVSEKLAELEKEISDKGYQNILIKGKINTVLENYPLAEKYFFEVTKKTPYWPKTYLELGNLFIEEGKTKEAIINYQLVNKILPDTNNSRLNDAHREVVKSYRKTIFKQLGDIYFKKGDFQEAEKNYQEAYFNSVDDFTLLKNIADTYYLRGDFAKALEYNLRGLKRNPGDYSWYLSTALIYKEMRNVDEAKKYFDFALELAPEDEVLLKLKAEY